MIRRSWPVLLLVLVSGCWQNNPAASDDRSLQAAPVESLTPIADAGRKVQEFDLYEPVVRYLMKPLAARTAPKPWVVYVTVPLGLSAEAFCERFAGNAIPVRVYDEAAFDTAQQSAYIIHICNPTATKICWDGSDRARILVSHHAVSEPFCRCDDPYPINVQYAGSRWVVVEP